MSKNFSSNIESDWGSSNKRHRQNKIKAFGKKSRSTGKQSLKRKTMDLVEEHDEESIYNW